MPLWVSVICPLFYNLFHAANCSTLQTDLNAMRMSRRFCENIFHDTFGQFACTLILLQDDQHSHTRFDGRASLSVHKYFNIQPNLVQKVDRLVMETVRVCNE